MTFYVTDSENGVILAVWEPYI